MSQLSIMFVAEEIKQTQLRKFSEVFFGTPFKSSCQNKLLRVGGVWWLEKLIEGLISFHVGEIRCNLAELRCNKDELR